MAVEEHEISRRPNDGSRNDMQDNGYDEHGYESRDRRSNTRTTYFEQDIPGDGLQADHLRRALRIQQGEYVTSDDYQSRGQQNHEEDKRRMVSSLSSQLELTDAQKERAVHLVLDVVDVNSFGRYSIGQVALAVINHVAREDARLIEEEEMFRDLMGDVGVDDLKQMRRLRAMVRERIP